MATPFSQYMRSPVPQGNSTFPLTVSQTPLPGAHATFATDERIELWTGRWSQAKSHSQLYESDWAAYWKWYRAWRQELTDPIDWWRSNEVIPTVFKIVETLVPRYVLGMFDSPDWFNVRGTDATDELHELAIGTLLRIKLEKMGIVPESIEALKYCTIMGHVWGKEIWHEEWRNRYIVQPTLTLDPETGIPIDIGLDRTKFTEKTYDGPKFSWVPLDRIKADPTGKGRWYIEEMDISYDELVETDERLGGVYKNLDAVQMGWANSGGVIAQSDYQEPQATEGIPQQYVTPVEGRMVHLWQCWGWVPPAQRGPDGEEWRLTVIADRSLIIRDIPSPTPDGKPPYFPIKSIPIPNRLYGDSLLKYIGPLQDQQTRLANHRLDEVMLNVWQQYVYDRSANIIDNELLFQPGGAIGVDGNPRDKFHLLERRPAPIDSYREDEYRQQQQEHVSGATDQMQGVFQTDRATATEIQSKQAQAGMRVTMQLLWFEETFKKELLRRTYELLQQRMPQEEVVRVLGSDGMQYDVTLDLATLQIPVDITVSGGLLSMSKQNKLQIMQTAIELGQSPVYGPYIRSGAVLQDLFREMGLHAVAKYVKSDEEVMLEQQMAMAPQGLGSGGPGLNEAAPSNGAGMPAGGGNGAPGPPMPMPPGLGV